MSVLVPLAISAGSALLGRVLGGKVKGPVDTTGFQEAVWNRRRATMRDDLDRNLDQTNQALTQKGITGSGTVAAMQESFRGNNDALGDFDAQMSDALARAKADFLNRRRGFKDQQATNRAGAVAQLGGAAIDTYNQHQLLNRLGEG